MRLRGGDEVNGLERINELSQRYDPLQYVLLFPMVIWDETSIPKALIPTEWK